MNQGDALNTRRVLAASKAMSGARAAGDDGAASLDEVRERLSRVMASIDRGLAASAAAPCEETHAPAPSTPPSSTAPSALSSRMSSSYGTDLTAPPPPRLGSFSRPPEWVNPAAAQPRPLVERAAATDPPLPRKSATLGQETSPLLPDASALLARWLLQDSQLGNSPLRRPPSPPPPLAPSGATTTATLNTLPAKLAARTHLHEPHTSAAESAPSTNDPSALLFSRSAEALWSSALSDASHRRRAAVKATEQGPSLPVHTAPVRRAPWLPSCLAATDLRDDFTSDNRVPHRVATDTAHVDDGGRFLSSTPPPPARALSSAVAMTTATTVHSRDDDDDEAHADRLFSLWSARYAPASMEATTTAAERTDNDVDVADGPVAPAREGVVAADAMHKDTETRPGDGHVADDGVVRSPPRPAMHDSETQTTLPEAIPESATDTMPPPSTSLVDILERRFRDQASSSLMSEDGTARSRRLYSRPLTQSPPRTFGAAHSALLLQATSSHLSTGGGRAASPCVHEEAVRQALMEERIRRTRQAHVVTTQPGATDVGRRMRTIPDPLAQYDAQRERIASEEDARLDALLRRYEEALREASSSPRKAAATVEPHDARRTASSPVRSSPLPRDVVDVHRRVQLLRQLASGDGHRTSTRPDATESPLLQASRSYEPARATPSTAVTHHSDSAPPRDGTLDIPTPDPKRLWSHSPPRDVVATDSARPESCGPLSIERDQTPERSVAASEVASGPTRPRIDVLNGGGEPPRQQTSHEVPGDHPNAREWSPEVDEHTQRPPPPRPKRRAPRADESAEAARLADQVTTPVRAVSSPPLATTERLYVSPTRSSQRSARQGDRHNVARTSSLSSSFSYTSSSLRASSQGPPLASARAQSAEKSREPQSRSIDPRRHEHGDNHARPPTPRVTAPRQSPSPQRDDAHVANSRRLAAVAFHESVRVLRTRGVGVMVQLTKSRVPALAQLSPDCSELLFIVDKGTEVAMPSVSSRPDEGMPPRLTQVTGSMSPRRPEVGGLVLNRAAASSRFATPPKASSPSPRTSRTGPSQSVSYAKAPPPPPGMTAKKVVVRMVRRPDGSLHPCPVGPPAEPSAVRGRGRRPTIGFTASPPRQRGADAATTAPRHYLPHGLRISRPLTPSCDSSVEPPSSRQSEAAFAEVTRGGGSGGLGSSGPPSTLSQHTASYRTDSRRPRTHEVADLASARGPIVHVRERHHFPLRHARLLLPGHVLGTERDQGGAGPRSFEDVHGLLCGPAACEVLRRYRCTVFADLAKTGLHTYRLFLVIPEFRRIDVPENAVLLVVDCGSRAHWVTMVLALQGIIYGEPYLSYGRALWLLAAHRSRYAHALRGLNPFETATRFAVANRKPTITGRGAAGGGRGSTPAKPPAAQPAGAIRGPHLVRRVVSPQARRQQPRGASGTSTEDFRSTSLLYRNELPLHRAAPPSAAHGAAPADGAAEPPVLRAEEVRARVGEGASRHRSPSVRALQKLFARTFRSRHASSAAGDSTKSSQGGA